MTKDELHDELDRVVPSGTKRRSHVRMVGHCLIELGLITSIECGYEHCVMPTRAFLTCADPGEYRGRGIATVDHVVSLSDGGDDRPSNLQLLHFACNGKKGSIDAGKNPEATRKRSEASRRRWEDPTYRARMTGRRRMSEETAKASASMKARWADPEQRAKHTAAIASGVKKQWETRDRSTSDEVRAKIAAGVRASWERRRDNA